MENIKFNSWYAVVNLTKGHYATMHSNRREARTSLQELKYRFSDEYKILKLSPEKFVR